MRENRCDSTLPGSTRCSLILQIETHATTTNIMRNVEYITNGFGLTLDMSQYPTGDALQRARQEAEKERLIGFALKDTPSVISSAILTYRTFGPAGFQRTMNFIKALQRSPQIPSTPVSGVRFKQMMNGAINTASSIAGLTPLSSQIVRFYRYFLQQVPDNAPDGLAAFSPLNQNLNSFIPRLSDIDMAFRYTSN